MADPNNKVLPSVSQLVPRIEYPLMSLHTASSACVGKPKVYRDQTLADLLAIVAELPDEDRALVHAAASPSATPKPR